MGKVRHENGPVVPAGSALTGPGLFGPIRSALQSLHSVGVERDKAGNRLLFFDQYFSLLLLYFFNPALASLNALQQSTGWERVCRSLGVRRTSMGSLSEAQGVFDARRLEPILRELAGRALPLSSGAEAEALRGLTAVDGSFFAALPRMAWALWEDPKHRAAKLHLHFEVFEGVPRAAGVTAGIVADTAALPRMLEKGRLYVLDRGYCKYELFAAILRAGSSFVARVQNSIAYRDARDQPLDEKARRAGVVRDFTVHRLGNGRHGDPLGRSMRVVIVRVPCRGGKITEMLLVTDRLDLPADLVALAYKYRWTIELFFRWLKCVLGARHLVAHSQNGLMLQMYAALIVSLLVTLGTGRKPDRRAWEMVQMHLLGWVTDAEFDAGLARLRARDTRESQKKG